MGWVRHLQAAGFVAYVQETKDLDAVKQRLGVPNDLAACHTAELAGYIVEGHVPVQALIRLLAERPRAIGLAVPGMPAGSPGMEGANPEAYDVVLFGKGTRWRYMHFIGKRTLGRALQQPAFLADATTPARVGIVVRLDPLMCNDYGNRVPYSAYQEALAM